MDQRFFAAVSIVASHVRSAGVHASAPLVCQAFDLADLVVKEEAARSARDQAGRGNLQAEAENAELASMKAERASLVEQLQATGPKLAEMLERRIAAEREAEEGKRQLAREGEERAKLQKVVDGLRGELSEASEKFAALKAKLDAKTEKSKPGK